MTTITVDNSVEEKCQFFAGARTQRGHGLGNILSSLFRKIVFPFVKRNAKMFGTRALKTGMEIADDVTGGKIVQRFNENTSFDGYKEGGI
jgi:hypothetical protein